MSEIVENILYEGYSAGRYTSVKRIKRYIRNDGTQEVEIEFVNGWKYVWLESYSGSTLIYTLMHYARHGSGLNTYLNQNKPPYASKFR